MSVRLGTSIGVRRSLRAWTAAALVVAGTAQAAPITAGTPITQVPAALSDPLATLADPLPAGQWLLPIEIAGASGLQDWRFDLGFDDGVVTLLDVGGLFQSVYQATFGSDHPTLSDITSGGLALPGRLQGVAGFSWGASGDGTLAYVLFAYQPGQDGRDPGFSVDDPSAQPVPEPGAPGLLAMAVLALGMTRRRHGAPRRAGPVGHA